MLKKFLEFFGSMKLTATLLLVFALSCATATFIENDFGTPTARALVYNAKWFELVMLLGALAILANIFRFQMYKPQKRHIFMFHVSFLVILAGAALTRYAGYEGIMHIREGETENRVISTQAYLIANAKNKESQANLAKPITLSKIGSNSINETLSAGEQKIQIKLKNYIPNAIRTVVDDPLGRPMASLVVAVEGAQPEQKLIALGDRLEVGGVTMVFLNERSESEKADMQLFVKDGKIHFVSTKEIGFFQMSDQATGRYDAQEAVELQRGRMYALGRTNVVPRVVTTAGKVELVSAVAKKGKAGREGEDALVLELSDGTNSVEATVMGSPQAVGVQTAVKLGATTVELSYGSTVQTLPITLKLDKFELQRYPGSMSPSSYASLVQITENGKSEPYKIYMNHTLDAAGYRFFQSSYDQDEKGTILSVSHDPGKIPTYIGYILLAVGMLWTVLNPKGRFMTISRKLSSTAAGFFVVLCLIMTAQSVQAADDTNSIIEEVKSVDKSAAKLFSTLAVQDSGGRIKPIDSLAADILHKVGGMSSVMGLNANEALFGMMTKPRAWQQVKMIKISHPQVLKLLGAPDGAKSVAFADIFEMTPEGGAYRIGKQVEEANRKRPQERDMMDKELLKLDERVNVCYMVYSGQLLRIFPKANDPKQTWLDPAGAITGFEGAQSEKIRSMMGGLFEKLDAKDGAGAAKFVEEIRAYQKEIGSAVYPSESRINAELWYNKLNIFLSLVPLYLACGLALLGLELVRVIRQGESTKIQNIAGISLTLLLTIGFVFHTCNLGLRWYISGHAPWSDGFESMTYIAWAVVLAGLMFRGRSSIAFALTGILAAAVLFTAHLSWMDPQITNIVPVLQSYWLVLHVSMITASYGFLALGAMLGFTALILFAIRSEKRAHLDGVIKELLAIDEMTLLIGLALLTIGNFLGGVWANESWGRYWGWDPKETWALVSILVYAAIIHTRYIPKLARNHYAFAVMSLFGFCSVVMTYFGVNFYLSGLHSYAAGDPIPVPTFVYVGLAVMIAVSVAAYKKRVLTA